MGQREHRSTSLRQTTALQTTVFRLLLILAAFSGVCSSAWGSVTISTDGESGRVVEQIEWIKPDQPVRLTVQDKAPGYWFLFSLRGVKGKTLAIDVVGRRSLDGYFNWSQTRPVVADARDLSDPLLYDERAYRRRHGLLPWRHVADTHYNGQTHTLSMKVHFDADEATVALTYPCPVSYVEKRLRQLRKESEGGRIGIYEAGTTDYALRGLPLRVVTVPGLGARNAARWRTKPTLLLYGGEYATEHESSQVVMGALEWLLSGDPEARRFTESYNVLLIPHLFPDQTVRSVYGGITDGFDPGDANEAFGTTAVDNVTWAKFWDRYVDAGDRLDVVVDFGNDGIGPNLFCPRMQVRDEADLPLVKSWNRVIMAQYEKAGLEVYPKLGAEGNYCYNLAGWLDKSFGATAIFYDVCSQSPSKRLSLTALRSMGVDALKGIGAFFADPKRLAKQQGRERKRLAKRRALKAAALADRTSLYNPKDPADDWVYNDFF